jgi:tagaturonate reductase
MLQLNRSVVNRPFFPIKVVQCGDGNFLRGFVDYIIDLLNDNGFNGGVAVVKNRPGGSVADLQNQQGLFTLFTEGVKNGGPVQTHRVVSCINSIVNPYEDYAAYLALAEAPELKIIVSNTTEAGIVFSSDDLSLSSQPHYSFPAKLTALLYRRFTHFKGDPEKGCIILPCELIQANANTLKHIVLQYAQLWQLGADFIAWLHDCNHFYNTLVDRIVSGYPKDRADYYTAALPYDDALITVCEPYLFWAVEADDTLLKYFPVNTINEDIVLVPQLDTYRIRKVRILNGLHTLLAQTAYLMGKTTVKESMDDPFCTMLLTAVLEEEILPTIQLPYEELQQYAAAVLDRFRNPFIKHRLADIAMNSVSKFKTRLLPVIDDYYRIKGVLPGRLLYALACLIYAYRHTPVSDEARVIEAFKNAGALSDTGAMVSYILNTLDFSLKHVPGNLFYQRVAVALQCVEAHGVKNGLPQFLSC